MLLLLLVLIFLLVLLLFLLVLLVVLPWMMPSLDPVRAVVVPPVTWLADHYLALAELVAGRPLG